MWLASNISLVIQNQIMREGLRRLMMDGYDNVESFADPEDFLGAMPQDADIIILSELFVPYGEYRAIKKLMARRPDAKIVVMGTSRNPKHISEIYKAGAFGYVSLESAFRSLRSQLDLVALGEKVYPAALIDYVPRLPVTSARQQQQQQQQGQQDPLPWPDLTARERAVLDGLVSGLPSKTIASRMEVSEATVKLALKTLFRKMQVRNRTHAAMLAREHGWTVRETANDRLH